jgi:hypothetical protein
LTSIVRDEQEAHRHLEDFGVDLEHMPLGGSGTAIGLILPSAMSILSFDSASTSLGEGRIG